MIVSKYILIGADPNSKHVDNPGGQATACEGLISYLESNYHQVKIIDTTQSSFPVPSIFSRLRKGFMRSFTLIYTLMFTRYSGVILFSSAGFSFYERAVQCLICKLFGVESILCVRSGHFITDVQTSDKYRNRILKFLSFPSYIGAQGTPWVEFYKNLGVDKKRLVLLRNWLPPEFPKATKPRSVSNNVISFLFVGWMVEKKGVRELLDAASKLSSLGYNFRLKFAGGGDLLEEVTQSISALKLCGKVEVLGWKCKVDIIEELRKSDVFVLPSKAEGFPNAMLEAMSLGLPCIVTDVGAVSDSLINDFNGFLLEDSNACHIYDAMLKYLENNNLVSKHSKNTLELVIKNHTAHENCKQLLSVFNI